MPEDTKDFKGLDKVLFNFKLMELIFHEEMDNAMGEALDLLYERMLENASLTCHTLLDLRRMGHPYAKRAPQNIHQPPWLVHLQTGKFLGAIKKVYHKLPGGDTIADIGIDEDEAPYASSIIFGTDTMVARDFITGTFEQSETDLEGFFEKAHASAIKRDP